MAKPVYPNSDLDSREVLVSSLGSHWADTYAGVDLVASYVSARARLEEQSFLDAQETVDTLSYNTVPIYHRRRWELLTLTESDRNGPSTSLLRYGDGAVYGNQPSDGRQYKYGEPFSLGTFAFPLPTKLRDVKIITNRLGEPSLTLTAGIDFVIDEDRGSIIFVEDPFLNSLVPQREAFEGSEVVDHECGLWLWQADFDERYVYQHWGYVLGIDAESSENYKELVKANFDAITHGTADIHVRRALAAITGVPFVINDSETVEVIDEDNNGQFVATDKAVYRFSDTANVIVEVGDTLIAGDPLVDAVEIFEFNRGIVPDDLVALTMGKGYLASGYIDGITFQNKTVPLEVTTDADGNTRVEFEVGGFPTDVEKFWDDIHTAGLAAEQTLANLLDRREAVTETIGSCDIVNTISEPVGEPQAGALPATINPLQFLVQNVLRNNVFVVRIKVSELGPDGVGLQHLRTMRRIIPPHTGMIILEELTLSDPTVTLDGPASDDEPGYTESAELMFGCTLSETITADLITDGCVTLRYVSGNCL